MTHLYKRVFSLKANTQRLFGPHNRPSYIWYKEIFQLLKFSIFPTIQLRYENSNKVKQTNWSLTDWWIDWQNDWLITDGQTDLQIKRLTAWLADRLIYWFIDSLTHWLTDDWLINWVTDRQKDWQTDGQTDRLTDWLTDKLTDWRRLMDRQKADWLTDWLTYTDFSVYMNDWLINQSLIN